MKTHRSIKMFIGLLLLVSVMMTGCRILAPEPTGTPTPTTTVTHTASPTVTLTPTVTSTRTPRPTATQTVQPTATLEPMLESIKSLMFDDEKLAILYPDNIEILHAEDEQVMLVDGEFGYTVSVPVDSLLYWSALRDFGSASNRLTNLETGQIYSVGVAYLSTMWEASLNDLKASYDAVLESKGEDYGRITGSDSEEIKFSGQTGYFLYMISANGDLMHYDIILAFLLPYSEDLDMMLTFSIEEYDVTPAEAQQVVEEAKDILLNVYASYNQTYIMVEHEGYPEYYLFTGICPTSTSDYLGLDITQPLSIVAETEVSESGLVDGKAAEERYLNSLLYNGQAIEYYYVDTHYTADGKVSEYYVYPKDSEDEIRLFLQSEEKGPYIVPKGFGCTGILYPEYLLSLYEELTKDNIDS